MANSLENYGVLTDRGSIPPPSANHHSKIEYAPLAQLAEASALEVEGSRFKSEGEHQNADTKKLECSYLMMI